jgi:glutathione S-transferase
MILVGQYDSPYVRRVAITLHHYGIPFERNPISVFGDAVAMAKINPLVRIPSLVLDDGEILIDSAAILDHLDEVVGAARALTPRAGPERRRVLQLVALATGTIDKCGAIVYERHFHRPEAVNQDWVARLQRQMLGGLTQLEDALEGSWLFADRMTQADVTAAVLLGYVRLRVADVTLETSFPKLARFADRCETLSPVAATRPSADEVMPA